MEWVDLSQVMSEHMPRAKASTPPRIRTVRSVAADRINLMEYSLSTHAGTHVDAPRHFIAGGATIDQVPIDRFYGEGVVLAVDGRPGEALAAEQLQKGGPVPRRGDIVLLSTGWGAKYDEPGYMDHPYLSLEAAHWLLRCQVKLVGFDVVTPEMPEPMRTPGFDWPVHHALLEGGSLIVENLRNLEVLAGRRVEVMALPVGIEGADGAPVRAVARTRD